MNIFICMFTPPVFSICVSGLSINSPEVERSPSLTFSVACFILQKVCAKTHLWKSALCGVTTGTDSSPTLATNVSPSKRVKDTTNHQF